MSIVIHDLQSAAERAKVTPEVILRWIAEGLKATPVGRVGRRGPRDYRIFDTWLIEFLEARAVRAQAPAATEGDAADRKPIHSRTPKPGAVPMEKGRFWPRPRIKDGS
jgi:hypothetical protein